MKSINEEKVSRLDLDDPGLGRVKYERLKAHLVGQMLAGRLKPGEALPSETVLAKQLGITRVTIRQAMASLENDGLVRRVRGKGNFVEPDVRRKLKRGQDIFALVVLETRAGYYPSLIYGFETAAQKIRHQTIVCNTENNVDRQADICLQLLDKEVGGVALNPTADPPTPAYQVRQFQKHGIPVVFLHRRVEEISAPLLAIPFAEVGRLSGKTLAELGHRRVAYCTAVWSSTSQPVEEGLREGLRSGGEEVFLETKAIGKTIHFSEDEVLAALGELFDKPEPPTAIVTGFDSLAETIYLVLPRLGLRIPEDVSLLGFGGAWREGAVTRRLTSVVIDQVATGQLAASLLHEMRRGERPIDDNQEILLELGLSDGQTLAPAKDCQRCSES